jgi:hypothetical protein
MSVRQVSQKLSKPETLVRNYLELLKLDEPIKALIRQGWWKDTRLAKALLNIPDAELRCALATRLFENKVSLKGCLAACERALKEMNAPKRGRGWPAMTIKKLGKKPALELAAKNEDPQKPNRWDMLRQAGKVPQWEAVVASSTATCDGCALRSIASFVNCRECGAVELLKKLMEAAQ